ncbi:MAG: integrase core domain-containing protein [Isosphaeraceae bacterium]
MVRILAWGLDLGEHPYEKRPKRIRLRGERECLSQGRAGYNAVRPHSSLGYATPNEFSAACDQRGTTHRTNVCG